MSDLEIGTPVLRLLRFGIFGLLLFAAATELRAHPPYEILERVVVDESGRRLRLVMSYQDGIFLSDPVKLVIRDARDRSLAETDYGRYVALLCRRPPSCTVFRYDGLLPVLPEDVWILEAGQLRPERSLGLVLLGVVAPLWTRGGAYLLAVVTLAAPVLLLWLVSRAGVAGWRTLLGIIASVFYLALWLYVVVLLSSLSLPLVILLGAALAGCLLLAARGLRLAGVPSRLLATGARSATVAVIGLGGAIAVAAVVLALWLGRMSSGMSSIDFEEPAVAPPLSHARITTLDGEADEIYARPAEGTRLEELVDLSLFDGFAPGMSRELAADRLGPPSGVWIDPAYRLEASYWQRPGGRVSLVRQGAATWTTVGHPAACGPDDLFRDARLRDQLLEWIPPGRTVRVNLLRSSGTGGLSIYLSRAGCEVLLLGARDPDP